MLGPSRPCSGYILLLPSPIVSRLSLRYSAAIIYEPSTRTLMKSSQHPLLSIAVFGVMLVMVRPCGNLAPSRLAASSRQSANSPQPAPKIRSLIRAFAGTWSTSEKYEPFFLTPNGGAGRGQTIFRPGPGCFTVDKKGGLPRRDLRHSASLLHAKRRHRRAGPASETLVHHPCQAGLESLAKRLLNAPARVMRIASLDQVTDRMPIFI